MVTLTLASAMRTVVVPRGEQVLNSRLLFRVVRWTFGHRTRLARTFEHRDRILARMAPTFLMLLPLMWGTLVTAGFAAMYWGVEADRTVRQSVVLSGSSLTTLGFRSAEDLPSLLLAIIEALLGLGIMALLISYLPTMYAAFAARETSVTKLHLRTSDAEGRPDHAAMLVRWWQIGAFERLPELWMEWEDWFVSVQESHTSFPALSFFRSPHRGRSWITAAGMALDQAGLVLSAVNIAPDPRAALLIRTGTRSLRDVAMFWGIEYDADPSPTDPVTVTREEFLEVFAEIASAGIPMRPDREQAWRDFAGWRVNYDTVLVELCALIDAPLAPWSSDRLS